VVCAAQNGQGGGILAAAIGLYHQVSARISGSSDGGAEVGMQAEANPHVSIRIVSCIAPAVRWLTTTASQLCQHTSLRQEVKCLEATDG
jgi:hypothetical protein